MSVTQQFKKLADEINKSKAKIKPPVIGGYFGLDKVVKGGCTATGTQCMPVPRVVVRGGMKVPKPNEIPSKPNQWLDHVKKIKETHPHLAYKDVLKLATLSYKK